MLTRLTCTVLLFLVFNSQAALLKYELALGGNSFDADGGTGTFIWNDVTQLISAFTWDFGGGMTGGISDSFNWAGQSSAGTQSSYLFEILTLTDIHPSNCSSLGTGCGFAPGPSFVFGFADNISFTRTNINTLEYSITLGSDTVRGSGVIANISPAPVPSPVPSPSVFSLFILGLVVIARKHFSALICQSFPGLFANTSIA